MFTHLFLKAIKPYFKIFNSPPPLKIILWALSESSGGGKLTEPEQTGHMPHSTLVQKCAPGQSFFPLPPHPKTTRILMSWPLVYYICGQVGRQVWAWVTKALARQRRPDLALAGKGLYQDADDQRGHRTKLLRIESTPQPPPETLGRTKEIRTK